MGERAVSGGRYGYWFPLVLLGFGLLGLLAWDSVAARADLGWFAYAPLSPETGHDVDTIDTIGTIAQMSAYREEPLSSGLAGSRLRDWTWAVLVTVTLVGTVAWYARRARRAGGSVRTHVALAVSGAIAVPACYAVAGAADVMADPAELVRSVGLPLLLLGALLGAAAYFRVGPWRRTAATIGVVCLVAGVGTVLGAWLPGLLAPVLIAAGLLAIARYERSRLLAVVAGTVFVALVVFPDGTLSTLIPAVVVLAAAIVTLVRRNGATAPA